MDKTKILNSLASRSADEIDRLRDKKLLEYKDILAQYHKAKDEEMVCRHTKRKELLGEGNSFSKVDNILRADDELFNMKRLVQELGAVKEKLKLEHEILSNYYWKVRA